MSNKPRIAFCFSGQARTLDQTYLFFQKNLFDAAKDQGFEYDVFCAVEDDEDAYKVNLLNPTKVEKIKSSEVEERMLFDINDDENLKYFDFEYAHRLPLVSQQQRYKIKEAFVLKDDYKRENGIDYDIVFRLRYDVYFINKIRFGNINSVVKKGKIICNNVGFFPNGLRSICDFYFICNDRNSFKMANSLFESYGELSKVLVSLRFLPITIATNLILILFKINFKPHFIPDKILLKLKWKYMFGRFVPELLLYKFFIFEGVSTQKSSIKTVLLRKDGQTINNGKGFTKFEF